MDACCRNYLIYGEKIIAEWARFLFEGNYHGLSAEAYMSSIDQSTETHKAVLEGAPCPWHDNPERYYADTRVIEAAGNREYRPAVNAHQGGTDDA